VDDGASDMEDARRLILEEYAQGVRLLVFTPHLREGYFDTSIDVVMKHYEELKEWVSRSGMDDLNLYLSREYHCDKRFEALLEGYSGGRDEITYGGRKYEPQKEILPFGRSRCILLEFSSGMTDAEPIGYFSRMALDIGFTPIIAHAERYPAVQKDVHVLDGLKSLGVLVQVNAGALLGMEGKNECNTANELVTEQIADIVASDTHDLEYRKPRLKRCYRYLTRNVGEERAAALMSDKAFQLITAKSEIHKKQ
jgi:protein-tyrosine phosphatase